MALELRQTLNLSQQLVMTPQLQQAIKLLQLSRLELVENIVQEMESNPVLEEQSSSIVEEDVKTGDGKQEQEKDSSELPEVTVEEHARDDVDWESYLSEYNTGWASAPYEERDTSSTENMTAGKTSLYSHLMWQLRMTSLEEEKREIGVHIIGNLDENGYLDVSLEEISQTTGYPMEDVLETLGIVQNFDPVGVAARDMRECLLIQVQFHNLGGTLVEKLITSHIGDLENRQYERVAKALDVPVREILRAVALLRELEPRPGRIYSEEESIYVTPDIYVYKTGNEYRVVLNEDGMPRLRVSSYYKDLLCTKDCLPENAREYIKEKLRSAAWLIKSIHQRQSTICRVTESIVRFQRDFLDNGISRLKPLVLRDVAEDIEMHESTVSRVTTNKYVHTPNGLFELKFFFNSAINRVDGDAIASESVKEQIRKIIDEEDKSWPLSDKEIEEIMRQHNIKIARRTVAKYRESMGILPSRKRRNAFPAL